MHQTWYVLEDGGHANPDEVAPDAKGVLRHKGGTAVAYGPHGPRTRGMSAADIEAAKPKRQAPPPTKPDREMKPKDPAKDGAKYETR